MKKIKSLIMFIIVISMLSSALGVVAYSDIPVQLDFSKGSVINGFSTHTYGPKDVIYGKIIDGRYVMQSDGVGTAAGTASFLQVYKNFDTPVTGGVIAIDYSFTFESGQLYAFRGLPLIVDSDGTTCGLLRPTTNANGRTYSSYGINNNAYSFQDTQWIKGQEYEVRLLCDLDNKTYRFYQAKAGEELILKQLADGSVDIPMNVANIEQIMFSFATHQSETPSVASFGYFKVYRYGGDDVYVSSEFGDDSNDGSFEAPFATYEKALESGSQHIYLMNGTYIFGTDYTYGTLNLNSKNATPFRPMVNSTIKVDGDYKIDFPELDGMNIKQEFKDGVLDRIRSDNYIASYSNEKVDISDVEVTFNEENNTLISETDIINPGVDSERFMFITAVYDNKGNLYRTVSQNYEIPKGKSDSLVISIELPADCANLGYYARTYLWNGDTLSPYIIPKTYGEVTSVLLYSAIDGSLSNLYDYSLDGETLSLSGSTEENTCMTVKVVDPFDNILYIDQYHYEDAQDFDLDIKIDRTVKNGVFKVYVYNGKF
ncbi:MAG: hypothetical protein J6A69_11350 [Clostridia bacterium]|nr:hypothetical protein [Clostridia bacterium]